MKLLLEFLLQKLDGAINHRREKDVEMYISECEDCFHDDYVVGNPAYDFLRSKYELLIQKRKVFKG